MTEVDAEWIVRPPSCWVLMSYTQPHFADITGIRNTVAVRNQPCETRMTVDKRHETGAADQQQTQQPTALHLHTQEILTFHIKNALR